MDKETQRAVKMQWPPEQLVAVGARALVSGCPARRRRTREKQVLEQARVPERPAVPGRAFEFSWQQVRILKTFFNSHVAICTL